MDVLAGRSVVFMRTEIDRWDPEPVYAQLADILRGQIERGELVPRQPLPSETYLVQHYGVSRGTARRAVACPSASRSVAVTASRKNPIIVSADGIHFASITSASAQLSLRTSA